MPEEFQNWSENLRFTPGRLERPGSEEELAELVRTAHVHGRTVRVVGAGHSMPPLVETREMLISMERLTGLASYDGDAGTATLRGGTPIEDAGRELFGAGLTMENTGDIDYQTIAGAFGTGTHGTGGDFGVLSTQMIGARMVRADGRVVDVSLEDDPDTFRAVRVALGTLGIFSQVKIRTIPAMKLRRLEWCVPIEDLFDHLAELVDRNRHFDFYWYPRRDEAKVRVLNPVDDDPGMQEPKGPLYREEVDWLHNILPRPQEIKYIEMEYAVPADDALDCFKEVRERVKKVHRRDVAWRLLYRFIDEDDIDLSICSGKKMVTIALLQNNTLPYKAYFDDIEPIFRSYGGRPHWGKIHSLKAEELRPLYPRWEHFREVRRRFDPDGTFLNPYVEQLLGLG